MTAYQIGVLLAYLAPSYHKMIIPELNNHKNGKASFQKLWILFQPDIDVYAIVDGRIAGFVVQSYEILEADKNTRRREDRIRCVVVTVWSLGYAGHYVTREERRFVIPSFEGTRDIASLDIFPTKYLKDNVDKRNELQARGKKYYKIIRQNPAHRLYSGYTLQEGSKWVGLCPRSGSRFVMTLRL